MIWHIWNKHYLIYNLIFILNIFFLFIFQKELSKNNDLLEAWAILC